MITIIDDPFNSHKEYIKIGNRTHIHKNIINEVKFIDFEFNGIYTEIWHKNSIIATMQKTEDLQKDIEIIKIKKNINNF